MIFGKTFRESSDKYQQHLNYLLCTRHKAFALFPKQMNNGVYVWLEFYYIDYSTCIYEYADKSLYRSRFLSGRKLDKPTFYKTKKGKL